MTTDSNHESAPSRLHERVSSLESSRRTWRWIAGLVAPAVFALLLWAVDKAQASAEHGGEMRATLDALRQSLNVVDLDVRELRARIMKLGNTDDQVTNGTLGANP